MPLIFPSRVSSSQIGSAKVAGTEDRATTIALRDILLRSGQAGLPRLMRRLLTGYAIGYNLRHGRHGRLSQSRYKPVVCDDDGYFTQLVRYILLNPIRGGW